VPKLETVNCSSVVLVYKNGLEIQNLLIFLRRKSCVKSSKMKDEQDFELLLKHHGYSEKIIKELWKWYDPSEKKGVTSY